jgi:hypothetical protein
MEENENKIKKERSIRLRTIGIVVIVICVISTISGAIIASFTHETNSKISVSPAYPEICILSGDSYSGDTYQDDTYQWNCNPITYDLGDINSGETKTIWNRMENYGSESISGVIITKITCDRGLTLNSAAGLKISDFTAYAQLFFDIISVGPISIPDSTYIKVLYCDDPSGTNDILYVYLDGFSIGAEKTYYMKATLLFDDDAIGTYNIKTYFSESIPTC